MEELRFLLLDSPVSQTTACCLQVKMWGALNSLGFQMLLLQALTVRQDTAILKLRHACIAVKFSHSSDIGGK